jgi:hypothetical protein
MDARRLGRFVWLDPDIVGQSIGSALPVVSSSSSHSTSLGTKDETTEGEDETEGRMDARRLGRFVWLDPDIVGQSIGSALPVVSSSSSHSTSPCALCGYILVGFIVRVGEDEPIRWSGVFNDVGGGVFVGRDGPLGLMFIIVIIIMLPVGDLGGFGLGFVRQLEPFPLLLEP